VELTGDVANLCIFDVRRVLTGLTTLMLFTSLWLVWLATALRCLYCNSSCCMSNVYIVELGNPIIAVGNTRDSLC